MTLNPHPLDMTVAGNYKIGSGPQVNAAANANFNGPNVKYPISAAAIGLPMLPGWDSVCRLCLNPGEVFHTASTDLYQIGVFGRDPAEPDDSNLGTGAYWQQLAWHEHGQEFTYVHMKMIPGRPYAASITGDLPNSGNKRGSFDANPAAADQFGNPRPYLQSPKIYEYCHADSQIDGNEGIPSNGHNALGLLAMFNRPGLPQQFTSNDASVPYYRPYPGTPVPQSGDWQAPWFQPALNDYRAWWTFAFGGGNVATADKTAGWALRPVIPDEVMFFVVCILKHDTAGRIRVWAKPITANGVLSTAEVTALTVNSAPILDYTGPTNQYVPSTDFDRTNPKSRASDSPQRLQKHPCWSFADLNYNGSVPPPVPFVTYASFPRRFTTLAAGMAAINGQAPPNPAPANVTVPGIAGSGVAGATLQVNPGNWTGVPAPTLTYLWRRDGSSTGVTTVTYPVGSIDVGKTITVDEIASNGVGSPVTATSLGVGPIQAAATTSGTPVHESTVSFSTFGNTDSQSVVVPAVANKVMLIQFAGKLGADALSVTVNGSPATLVAFRGQRDALGEMWQVTNPPSGPVTVGWVKSGASQNITWAVSIYSGVHQVTPVSAAVAQTGMNQDITGGAKTLVVASAIGYLIHAMAVFVGGPTGAGPTVGGTLTSRWSRFQSTTQGVGATVPGAPSVTVSFTPAGTPNYDWSMLALSLVPAQVVVSAPTIQEIPLIAGDPTEDQLLSATNGVFDEHAAATTYADQWLRCDPSGLNCVNASVYQMGHKEIGGSSSQFNEGFRVGNIFQAPANGVITEITAYMEGSGTVGQDQDFRADVYNASDAVTITTLVAAGAPVTIPALQAAGWVTFHVNAAVVAGQYYEFGLWAATPTGAGPHTYAKIYWDTTGGALGHYHAETYNAVSSPASPWGTDGTEDHLYSMVAGFAATSATYPAQAVDVGGTVRVRVTATNAGGPTPATSLPTAVIADALQAPVNNVIPEIDGVEQQNETMSITDFGDWDGDPVFGQQWRTCNSSGASCTDIPGETDTSYVLGAGDVGKTVRVRVTGTNLAGDTDADSAASGVIAAATTLVVPAVVVGPTLAGPAISGDVLTINNGLYDPPADSFAYRWFTANSVGGSPSVIVGQTGKTYTVVPGDIGKTIIGEETPSNGAGAGTLQVTVHSAVVTGSGGAISGLIDQFTGALNLSLWATDADAGTSITTLAGRVVFDLGTDDDVRVELVTVADYDLTGGKISAQFLSPIDPGDPDAKWFLQVNRTALDYVRIEVSGRLMTAIKSVGGVKTTVTDALQFRPGLLQIREASGTLHFEYGATYTRLQSAPVALGTLTNPFVVTAVKVHIGAERGDPQ